MLLCCCSEDRYSLNTRVRDELTKQGATGYEAKYPEKITTNLPSINRKNCELFMLYLRLNKRARRSQTSVSSYNIHVKLTMFIRQSEYVQFLITCVDAVRVSDSTIRRSDIFT
jgi:hypothetical protein